MWSAASTPADPGFRQQVTSKNSQILWNSSFLWKPFLIQLGRYSFPSVQSRVSFKCTLVPASAIPINYLGNYLMLLSHSRTYIRLCQRQYRLLPRRVPDTHIEQLRVFWVFFFLVRIQVVLLIVTE